MITKDDDGVTVQFQESRAKVVGTDIMAANGVIHAIDTVLLPSTSENGNNSTATDDVLATIFADDRFSELEEHIKEAGITAADAKRTPETVEPT